MVLTTLILKALNRAAELHHGQYRKSIERPYIVHPVSAAWILSEYCNDDEVIAAALLHDVLEDVQGYGAEEMRSEFGERVTQLVKEVTEDKDPDDARDPKATWLDRKQKYVEHLHDDSEGALYICAADKLHNLLSLQEAYRTNGKDAFAKFNAPIDQKLQFYGQAIQVLRKRLSSPIVVDLERIFDDVSRECKEFLG